jgi:serine/threonine protein kinase
LTGKRPVNAKAPSGAFSERGKVPAPSIQAVAPNAPAALKALYAKLTAKDPAQRPQSAQELLSDLQAVAKGRSPQPNALVVPELEPDRIGGGLAIFVIAALLAGFLFHYTTNVLALKDPFAGFTFPLEGTGYDTAPVTSSSSGSGDTAPVGTGGASVGAVDSKTGD